MRNAFLIGERIYLRPLDMEDLPVVTAYINDPDVRLTLTRHLPLNVEREREWLANLGKSESDVVLGIAIKADDRLIGSTGLHRINSRDRHAMFGLCIGVKEEWRKGYGTEATRMVVRYGFDTLNLNRIWLGVFEDNGPAKRVYEKAGFRKEGALRHDTFRAGRYWDTILMGLLRDEWRKEIAGKG